MELRTRGVHTWENGTRPSFGPVSLTPGIFRAFISFRAEIPSCDFAWRPHENRSKGTIIAKGIILNGYLPLLFYSFFFFFFSSRLDETSLIRV